jgi:hypothetical protein
VAKHLAGAGVDHIVIREPDEPHCGAAMAIGVRPLPRSTVRRALRHLRLYGGPS